MATRLLALFLSISVAAAAAAFAQPQAAAPYAGFERREIASLSASDLAEIRAGQGWGLALPAELNGVPGPVHLLELAAEIGLADAQIAALAGLRDRMRNAAIEAGAAFIAAEQALGAAFVDGPPDAAALALRVAAAETARAKLRLAHLAAHLETLPLLSQEQIAAYKRLRGYAGEHDGSRASPERHMHRRH